MVVIYEKTPSEIGDVKSRDNYREEKRPQNGQKIKLFPAEKISHERKRYFFKRQLSHFMILTLL